MNYNIFIADLVKDLLTLFIIVNPLGAVPAFLAMTKNDTRIRQKFTSLLAAITSTTVLLVITLVGKHLFSVFNITIDAFRLVGAVLLFIYAMDLINMRIPRMRTTKEEVAEGIERQEVGVIPLGLPILAGPAAIATVLVLRLRVVVAPDHQILRFWALITAIVLVGVSGWVILRIAVRMQRWLGPVGMGIFLRVEGLLLAVIAMQMALTGIQGAFGLPQG